jgi:hypothetical protein
MIQLQQHNRNSKTIQCKTMTVFSAETDSYQDAYKLVKNLQVAGIESHITTGAVSIHCRPDQVNLAQTICSESNAIFRCGYIGKTQELLSKTTEGVNSLIKCQGDARSVVNEWKN